MAETNTQAFNHLVDSFWEDVFRKLLQKHDPETSRRGVKDFRAATLALGDIVFNQGVDQAAEAIDAALRRSPTSDQKKPVRPKKRRVGA